MDAEPGTSANSASSSNSSSNNNNNTPSKIQNRKELVINKDLIINVIGDLNEKKGSSLQAIVKYIKNNSDNNEINEESVHKLTSKICKMGLQNGFLKSKTNGLNSRLKVVKNFKEKSRISKIKDVNKKKKINKSNENNKSDENKENDTNKENDANKENNVNNKTNKKMKPIKRKLFNNSNMIAPIKEINGNKLKLKSKKTDKNNKNDDKISEQEKTTKEKSSTEDPLPNKKKLIRQKRIE